MLMFTLAISYLTTSNLFWFMYLTFQVPMQYCSLRHRTLLPSPVPSTTGCCFCFDCVSSFFLELFLHWYPVAYWAPTDLGSSSPGDLWWIPNKVPNFHSFNRLTEVFPITPCCFLSPFPHKSTFRAIHTHKHTPYSNRRLQHQTPINSKWHQHSSSVIRFLDYLPLNLSSPLEHTPFLHTFSHSSLTYLKGIIGTKTSWQMAKGRGFWWRGAEITFHPGSGRLRLEGEHRLAALCPLSPDDTTCKPWDYQRQPAVVVCSLLNLRASQDFTRGYGVVFQKNVFSNINFSLDFN